MRESPIKLLDVVALTADLPSKGLQHGQIGTVVKVLSPDAFEVESATITAKPMSWRR